MVYASFLIIAVVSSGFGAAAFTEPPQDPKKPTADDAVRLSAALVQVPAVVTDRSGKFVSDLARNEFTVSEDGKRQDISFFTAVKQPFNAVLVLDTSNSAQDRLRVIQNAAVEFTKQLRSDDGYRIRQRSPAVDRLFLGWRGVGKRYQGHGIWFWQAALRSRCARAGT